MNTSYKDRFLQKLKGMRRFIVDMFSADKAVSAKRVCGVVGFQVAAAMVVYSAISQHELPAEYDMFLWASVTLLGVETVAGAFKGKSNGKEL